MGAKGSRMPAREAAPFSVSLLPMIPDPHLRHLAEESARRLLSHRKRLTTAESCTGGWLAKTITDLPGSSQWFECGFVTYSNAAKVRDLGVSPHTLEKHGAVSEATALRDGARRAAIARARTSRSPSPASPAPTAARPTSRSAPCGSPSLCATPPIRRLPCSISPATASPFGETPCVRARVASRYTGCRQTRLLYSVARAQKFMREH